LVLPDIGAGSLHAGDTRVWGAAAMVDIPATEARLRNHLRAFTVEIGERSVRFPLMFFGYPKEGDFIGIVGNSASRALTRSIYGSFQKNPDMAVVQLTVPFNGWIMPAVRLSDHASFWDEGFQAVMITDSAFFRNPHYHLPTDRMETLDFRFMAALVEGLETFLAQPP
jgi:hypothetical protein